MIPTSSAPSSLGTSSPPPYVKQGDLKKPEPPLRRDTVDPAAATEWTPPSCLARYCTYVKHRIADFFDWVCSLFCSSKPATKEQLKAVAKKGERLFDEINFKKRCDKRYEGVTSSSEDDTYRYLADFVEAMESNFKLCSIVERWEKHEKSLDQGQQCKSGVVLTERQLRADGRQIIELVTRMGIFVCSDLPKKTTPAMIDKVKAYSLGKLTVTKLGKVISLVDEIELSTGGFGCKFDELVNKIRTSSLEKFDSQINALRRRVDERYKEVTPKHLKDKSQAVHVLAHCIAVKEIWGPLDDEEGDISEESLTKRIATLEKRLAQPVLGEATKEMYKKVKEHDFTDRDDPTFVAICLETPPPDIAACFRGLEEAVAAVQGPQGQK